MKDITTGEEIFDNKQRLSVKLEYDKNGREVLRKFGNGTAETTLYDKAEKTYAQTVYAYDAFGRRVIVQDKGEAAVRTLYDGFTFDVIKQSSTLANGLFTDSNNTGIRWSPTGKPTGDRYRYISDEDAQDDNRYFYLDENIYKTVNSRYRGERTQISVNGSIAAQASSEGEQYFTTDLLGSIFSVTDSYGYQLDTCTYDVFGSLVQGELSGLTDFGYLGKQHDPTSKLYNVQNGNFLFEGMDSAFMYGTAGGLMVGGVNVCFPTILPGNLGQIIKDQIISTSTEQVIEEKMNEKCTKISE